MGSSRLRIHLTYWWRHRRLAQLATPMLFTEWVQHRKLHDRDPRLPVLADKVTVKVPRKCFQASTKSAAPYEFHTFSRFGGQKNGPHDALKKKTLDS